jgi:hypothetical protein
MYGTVALLLFIAHCIALLEWERSDPYPSSPSSPPPSAPSPK